LLWTWQRAATLLVKAAPFLDGKTTDASTHLAFIQLQGNFQMLQKQFFAAQSSFLSALAELERISTANNQAGIAIYINLAVAYGEDGNYLQAETNYRRALSIGEKIAPTNYILGYALEGLGNTFRRQKKYEEAEEPMQRGTRILEQHFGANHPETARVQVNLAINEVHLGRLSEAQPLFERAVKSL
jgi:nephrocystin-3